MYTICEMILLCIICHLLGDYVLQSEFIAKTKGDNMYHLFVHSVLYCVPFYLIMNINIYVFIALCIWHFCIDMIKDEFKMINYLADQILHYIILVFLILVPFFMK